MLDNMSDGRLIAGFARIGSETFNYDVPAAPSRRQFWEAVDLIRRLDAGRPVRVGGPPLSRYASIRGRGPTSTRIRRSGSRARARPKPWSTSPSAATASCHRAATAAKPRNRRRNSPGFSPTTATASIPSAWASCCRPTWRRPTRRRGRKPRRSLVLPQELPEGTPAARGPPAHRRAGHSLHRAVRVSQLSPVRRSDRSAARRRRGLERSRALAIDHRRQPGDGLSPHLRPHRARQGRPSVDPVPHGQHGGRAHPQEHAVVRR